MLLLLFTYDCSCDGVVAARDFVLNCYVFNMNFEQS